MWGLLYWPTRSFLENIEIVRQACHKMQLQHALSRFMIRPHLWALQHILESKPKLNKMFMGPTDELSLISHSAVYEVRIWRGYLKMWQRIMKPRHWKWHGITYRNALHTLFQFSSSAVCHGVCGSMRQARDFFQERINKDWVSMPV